VPCRERRNKGRRSGSHRGTIRNLRAFRCKNYIRPTRTFLRATAKCWLPWRFEVSYRLTKLCQHSGSHTYIGSGSKRGSQSIESEVVAIALASVFFDAAFAVPCRTSSQCLSQAAQARLGVRTQPGSEWFATSTVALTLRLPDAESPAQSVRELKQRVATRHRHGSKSNRGGISPNFGAGSRGSVR
jgi:hypothetical protein